MTLLRTLSIASILFMISSGTASAIFISTDLYTEGDGLATYDDQTGLLWLDLSVTFNMSYSEALAYKSAEGWHIATEQQFAGLAETIFPDFTDNRYGVNFAQSGSQLYRQIEEFQNLFGYVYHADRWPSEEWSAWGMYLDEPGNIRLGGAAIYAYNHGDPLGLIYGNVKEAWYQADKGVPTVGTFLVRTKVAEPSSLILLGIGLLVLGFILRRFR
jgi:hypothetical protein